MPRYDWKCRECGEVTEVERTIKTRNQATKCVHCGSKNTVRLWTPAPFRFKGGKPSNGH